MNPFNHLNFGHLGLASLMVVLSLFILWWQQITLKKTVIIACLRTLGQLLLLVIILEWIFTTHHPLLTVTMLLIMWLLASYTGITQAKQPLNWVNTLHMSTSLGIASLITLIWVTQVVVHTYPWYNPAIMITVAGMILGNALTASTLALERFEKALEQEKNMIEARLALGASQRQAIQPCFNQAFQAALTPTLNALMIVGVVHIPGVTTGQMLSGQSPWPAVLTQVVIMYMVLMVAVLTVALLLNQRCKLHFNAYQQLISPYS